MDWSSKELSLSAKEFFLTLGKWGWIVGGFIVLTILTGILPPLGVTQIPTWAWIVSGFITILLASFVSFHKVRIERDKLAERIKPKLMVSSAKWSYNRELAGGTWALVIENEGIDDVDGIGILEQIEFANPEKNQSMSAHSQNCALIWDGSNPVPGKCTSMLDVIYREPDTFSSYHYGVSCNNYSKKSVGLPTDMDILLIIAVKAKDTTPLFSICYFLGKNSIAFDRFEVLSSNLKQRPSIEDCRKVYEQNKERLDSSLFSKLGYKTEST